MPIEYNINLDVGVADTQLILNCKNTDTARSITATFHNGGTPIMLTSNNFAVFVAKKPDGKAIINDCTVDLINNCIRYDITPQTVAAIGTVKCEIHLFDVLSSELASPTFNIVVRKALASETDAESSDEYNSLTGLYAEIKTAFEGGELNGITPLIRRSAWDRFEVSYDKGVTYEPIAINAGTEGLAYSTNATTGERFCRGIGSAMESDIVLSNQVSGIGVVDIVDGEAFKDNTFITSVIFPSGYKQIRSYAFAGCNNLERIRIAETVFMLNYAAFQRCSSLRSVVIPSSVTIFSTAVFRECTSLQRVSIPKTIPELSINAFYGCTALTDIFFDGTKTEWNAIPKQSNWNYNTGAYTIHCTDGDLAKT